MMKNSFIFITFLAVVLSQSVKPVRADMGVYGQYGQYGQPSPSQSILIDKKVGKPNGAATKGGVVTVEYVDNLTPSDVRYRPGQEVMFQLKVKNTSNVEMTNVTVKDFVPSYMEPIEGPGAFDTASRTVSFNAGTFRAGEEKVYYVKMKLFGQAQMPADKGLFCLTNKAQAYNNNVSDDDTAQFCIEKEVVGVKEAPKAGPEAGILILGANVLLTGIGLSLKKFSK